MREMPGMKGSAAHKFPDYGLLQDDRIYACHGNELQITRRFWNQWRRYQMIGMSFGVGLTRRVII